MKTKTTRVLSLLRWTTLVLVLVLFVNLMAVHGATWLKWLASSEDVPSPFARWWRQEWDWSSIGVLAVLIGLVSWLNVRTDQKREAQRRSMTMVEWKVQKAKNAMTDARIELVGLVIAILFMLSVIAEDERLNWLIVLPVLLLVWIWQNWIPIAVFVGFYLLYRLVRVRERASVSALSENFSDKNNPSTTKPDESPRVTSGVRAEPPSLLR